MHMMDTLVFSRSGGNRSISASSAERTLLLGALATHMGVLDTRENDSQTVTKKAELWDEITRHFNSNATTPRSKQQIQTLYKNMKAKARRYEARLAEMANGIPPPDPDPISEMLLGLLQQQLRHQRRHLENFMTRDSSSLHSNISLSPVVRQSSAAFNNPEQMVQVFLSEGTTEVVDIKSKGSEELARGPEPNRNSSPSVAYPETLESVAKPSLPSNLLESTDDSKLSSSPLSPLTDDSLPSSIINNCKDEDLSPNPSNTHEICSQNLQAALSPLVQSPSVTKDVQCIKVDPYPPQSIQNGDFLSLTSSIDAIAMLKTLHNSKEIPNKRSYSETLSETTSPVPKRPYLEHLSRNYLASVSKMFCCHSPDLNAKLTCYSPETQSKLVAMVQEEHQMKVTLLKKEIEQKDREHEAKMKKLTLELEEAKLRIEKIKTFFSCTQ